MQTTECEAGKIIPSNGVCFECGARPDQTCRGKKPPDWRDAEIQRLKNALENIAYSGRTKTGMKEQARDALFHKTPNVE